jgi:hypothetical protein
MDIESELAELIAVGNQMCVPFFLISLREVPTSMDPPRRIVKVLPLNLDRREEKS